ncbi:MAG: sigma-70 family RNA polymerase sigma factor [Planctomycetes bacterium]|nr:sigma-70 family RNA polymerase sigma factor [Planctomycetota bacterium]
MHLAGRQADERLIRGCLTGDEESWRGLLARYTRFVGAIVRRILANRGLPHGTGEVEEETAEFFGDLCLHVEVTLGGYRRDGAFRAYLAVLAANHARRKAVRLAKDLRRPDLPAEGPPVAGTVWAAEDAGEVRATLAECNSGERLLFELLFTDGAPPDQVASLLGITRDALYVRKHRLLRKVRALFDERSAGRGRSPSDGGPGGPRGRG